MRVFLALLLLGVCSYSRSTKYSKDDFSKTVVKEGKFVYLNVPFVQQKKNYCVLASASMIIKFYKEDIDQTLIAKLSSWGSHKHRGTYFGDLTDSVSKFGYKWRIRAAKVKDFENSFQKLKKELHQKRPVMVAIDIPRQKDGHAIVVVGYDDKNIFCMDPSGHFNDFIKGLKVYSHKEFNKAWPYSRTHRDWIETSPSVKNKLKDHGEISYKEILKGFDDYYKSEYKKFKTELKGVHSSKVEKLFKEFKTVSFEGYLKSIKRNYLKNNLMRSEITSLTKVLMFLKKDFNNTLKSVIKKDDAIFFETKERLMFLLKMSSKGCEIAYLEKGVLKTETIPSARYNKYFLGKEHGIYKVFYYNLSKITK